MHGWTIPRRPRPAAQAPEGGQAAPGRRPPGPARRQRRLRGLPPPRADEERAAVVLVGAAALFVVLVVAYELGHDGRSPIRKFVGLRLWCARARVRDTSTRRYADHGSLL